MGEILAENGRAWFGNKIVSLTQVYVTTDLGFKIYLGMSMIKEADENLMHNLKE